MQILKQSTQVIVRVGPFVDVGDGFTPQTDITLAGNEAELLKNASVEVDISARTWAAVAGCRGWYDLTLTTSDTDAVGLLTVVVQDDSDCLPVFRDFQVVEENVFDGMFAASGDLMTTIDSIETKVDTIDSEVETLDGKTDSIKADTLSILQDTGTTLPATLAAILTDTGTTLDAKLDLIWDVLEADSYIDTVPTPWQLVTHQKGVPGNEYMRKDLKDENGANVIDTDTVITKHSEPA